MSRLHARGCGCACCRDDDGTNNRNADDLLDTITWGTTLDDNTITVYFVPAGQSRTVDPGESYTADGFNAYEKAQFQKAFDLIAHVVAVDFQIVNGATAGANADFQMVLDTNEVRGDFLGVFNPPGETFEGVGVFDGSSWDRSSGGDLEMGGFGFVTIVHELLHGMGLAHPHDRGGTSSIMAGVNDPYDLGRDDLNQGLYTTMTYNSGFLTGGAGSEPAFNDRYGYEAGPMALDIAALQALYGAPNHATASNTYMLPDTNAGGTYWQTIWDTGGVDELRYDGPDDATIDLRPASLQEKAGGGGYLSAADGVAGGFTIANGVVIENATGGAGDDRISGNDADNLLTGKGGADDLRGRAGEDILHGDGGDDDLRGGGNADRLAGAGGRDALYGGAGGDRMSGGTARDELYGEDGQDTLLGNNARDLLYGGAARDVLEGGRGVDRMYGGSGSDTLRGDAGRDVLIGGGDADKLSGGGGADVFRFETVGHSRAGNDSRDEIRDFNAARDVIDLRAIDADTTRGGNQAFDLIGTAAFGSAGDLRVTRQDDLWRVQGDVDGDGTADLEILVRGDSPIADSFLF